MAPSKAAPLVFITIICLLASILANPVPQNTQCYFFNSISGKSQWEDPGDTPYIDDKGTRWWQDTQGKWLDKDPNPFQYVWVEYWSEQQQQPFYFNQETKQAVWERPIDLAWRRVCEGVQATT